MIREILKFQHFLDSVTRFVRGSCVPAEDETAETGELPLELVTKLRSNGYFGWSIPEAYGGSGLTAEELILAAIELSQCSPAVRARVGTNTGIGAETLIHDGTEAQRRQYLPLLSSGEMTSCFALTEPNAGSDASALETTAVRTGSGWILNGRKAFITNAPIGDVFTIFAKTESGSGVNLGITAFLVNRRNPGLTLGPAIRKMGQTGSPVGDVVLQDCGVSDADVLGNQTGTGFQSAMKTLVKQRIHLAALCIGPAIRMLHDAIEFAQQRRQFGQPIANFQLIKAMIADSRTDIYAAVTMVVDAARRHDAGEEVRIEASMCKYFASEMCGRVADRAVQIHGGAGYVEGFSIERFYRDVRLFRLYEGTSQIHQLTIAKYSIRSPWSELAFTGHAQ